MTTDTKVADLPAKWRAKAKRIRGITAGSDLAADIMEGSAEDLEAALARQDESAPTAAQAVDLEQFRDCVVEAKEVWLQNAENWKGRSRESRYREWVDDCDRLLALIDQQAGKGVDRA